MSTTVSPDFTRALALPPGRALDVRSGCVVVFVVPKLPDGRPGRRIPVCEVRSPGRVVGAELPGAVLLAAALPGTDVCDGGEASEADCARMRADAERATAQAARRAEESADVQVLQARHDERTLDDSLLGLAAAVPGPATALDAGSIPGDVGLVAFLARQVGLHPNPLRLRRALADAEVSGRDRVTALAAAAGAAVRRVELPAQWWGEEGPPVMLTAAGSPDRADSGSTAAAVAVWRRGAYRIWKPETGLGPALTDETAGGYGATGILFEPLLDPRRPATMRDLLRLGARGSRNSLTLIAVLTGLLGLLAAVLPVVSGSLTQSVASQTTATLLVVGGALVALAVTDVLLRAVRNYAMLRVRGRGVAIDATAVWDRLIRLPMRFHNERTVASRVTDANAVDTASMSMSDGVVVSLLDIALVGGAIVGVFTASLSLAVGMVAFLAIRAAVEIWLVRRSTVLTRRVLEANTSARSLTLDLITGVNRLRVSGATARGFARWADRQSHVTQLQVAQRRLDVVQQMFGALWWVLGLAVIFTIVAITHADVGQLVTAQAALTAAMKALGGAVSSVGAGLSAAAVLRRAEAVLQAQPESGTGQEVAELAGAIDMRDVVFRYRDDLPPVLTGVNLTIPAGAHVAIVGPSGSGKSTLLRLLLGLEDMEAGIVSFDGRDLSGLDKASVRRQIGVVMQSSQLMPGSIRDNVDLGRGLSSSRIWDALEAAAVADDVRAMPMGLSTMFVEGGGTISGGQRQRILLARALAGKPRILMLDEATSALDNVSQAAVVANLERLRVTRVVVAHRLSTIEQADLIVMISGGVVAEQGSFDDLMSRDGPFRALVARQQI